MNASDITEPSYFTLADVELAFTPVAGEIEAKALARTWSELFQDCIVDGRVVALPASFGVPRLGSSVAPCQTIGAVSRPETLESLHGGRLLRFSPGTLTLVAAANPRVRATFDRLGIEYGYRTIDDKVKWKRLIDFLKNP